MFGQPGPACERMVIRSPSRDAFVLVDETKTEDRCRHDAATVGGAAFTESEGTLATAGASTWRIALARSGVRWGQVAMISAVTRKVISGVVASLMHRCSRDAVTDAHAHVIQLGGALAGDAAGCKISQHQRCAGERRASEPVEQLRMRYARSSASGVIDAQINT